jgi:hypothetical protein
LSVKVIVPVRFVPLAENKFVNLTPTVQLAPGANVAPVQLFAPATRLKEYVKPLPPDVATLVTATCAPVDAAVLVRVTVPVPVMFKAPLGNVMVSGFGEIERLARADTPAPVSVTGVGVTVAPVYAIFSIRGNVAAVAGAKTTLMVHEAPTANVVPQVPPAVPEGREKGAPPTKVNEPPPKATLPLFVTVRLCAELVVPVAQLPNAKEFGVTVADRVNPTPVPLRDTGEPVTATLAVIVALPVVGPLAVGANTTLIVQEAPAASVPVQEPAAVPVGREKGAVTTIVMPVADPPPVLLNVRVFAALVVPSVTLPKDSDVGETASTAFGGGMTSTAPTSIGVPGSAGLGLPKKSVLGAKAAAMVASGM